MVKGPNSSPEEIAAVVSTLHSETVQAPRNLSGVLLGRLEQISELHRGAVPLHGRLFAQWMHHAYPRECPFPHVHKLGVSDRAHAVSVVPEATEAEMELLGKGADAEVVAVDALVQALPWSMAEELVAAPLVTADAESASLSSRALRLMMAALVIVSIFVPLARSSAITSSTAERDDKSTRFLV